MPQLGNLDSLWCLVLPIFRRDVIATEMTLPFASTDQTTVEAGSTFATGDSITVLLGIASRALQCGADLRLLILRYFEIDLWHVQRFLEESLLRLLPELRHDHRIPTVVNRASVFHNSIVPILR